ncbi:MAG TPA: tetratricopeptide repeat protein, partial [Burkholderiales bacterium]
MKNRLGDLVDSSAGSAAAPRRDTPINDRCRLRKVAGSGLDAGAVSGLACHTQRNYQRARCREHDEGKRMSTPNLDDEELLHLALNASSENRHEEAISYLKQALNLAPANAKAHYMLGAEHAQIGLYDRATEEMAAAVKLDPDLVTAHFQLGLLHITSGRAKEAEDAWKPLDRLDREHPLHLFKTGLLHLARDEFAECGQC